MNKLDEIFLQIYPVGSIFCSTQSTPPSMGGSWELVKEDVREVCETEAKGELLSCFQDYSKEPKAKVKVYLYKRVA